MSVAHEPAHTGPWTVDDVLAMPEDDIRYEVVDGALIVSPPPAPLHQRVSYRVHRALEEAVSATSSPVEILDAVGLALPDKQMLIPDLMVVRPDSPSLNESLIDPVDVLLVVEIVSTGSTTRDRTEKPYLYAEAGIPHFWRIELGNFRGRKHPLPVIFVHELAGIAEYKVTHTAGAGQTLRVEEPFPVEFDPASLVP